MSIKLLAVVVCAVIFVFVLDLVRRRKLTFKYALGWLFVAGTALFFSIFHQLLFQCAAFLGFELPSNFIFFSLLCVFVFLSLLLTVFLCEQNERNDRMAQKIAILESEINALKKEN